MGDKVNRVSRRAPKRHSSIARAAARQRARRILTEFDFLSPERILLASLVPENRGLYDRSVLNVAFLIDLAQPLPRRLRRKLSPWIRTVRDERVRLYRELKIFGQPYVPPAVVEQFTDGEIAEDSAP